MRLSLLATGNSISPAANQAFFQARTEKANASGRGQPSAARIEKLAEDIQKQDQRSPSRIRKLGRGEMSCARRSSSKQIRIVR